MSGRLRLRQARSAGQMRAALMAGSICAARSFPSGCNSTQHVKDGRKDGLPGCRCHARVQSPSGSLLQLRWLPLTPSTIHLFWVFSFMPKCTFVSDYTCLRTACGSAAETIFVFFSLLVVNHRPNQPQAPFNPAHSINV